MADSTRTGTKWVVMNGRKVRVPGAAPVAAESESLSNHPYYSEELVTIDGQRIIGIFLSTVWHVRAPYLRVSQISFLCS